MWLAPLVLILLALGALGIGLTTVFVPFSQQAASVAALSGKEYADVQLGHFARNPVLIRSHAGMGVLFVLVAALQFWKSFRNRDLKRHRWLGYVGLALLVLLPTTGVASAIVYPFSGIAGVVPNVVWGVVIVFCVWRAWRAIKQKDVFDHEAWVTRASAMTVGITLSRVYEPILVQGLHMESHLAVALVFWLGQGEGLITAEFWLRRPGGPMERRARRLAALA